MAAWVDRLKTKWGVHTPLQFWAIMLTFTLAGLSITRIRPLFWGILGFTPEWPATWIKTITYILLVFPTYQISLMVFGTLLGQFAFFWEKEKKMARFFLRPFRRKPKVEPREV